MTPSFRSTKNSSDVKGQKTEDPFLHFAGTSVIFILVRGIFFKSMGSCYCHMDFFFSWFLYRHPNIVAILKKRTSLLVPFFFIVGILFGFCWECRFQPIRLGLNPGIDPQFLTDVLKAIMAACWVIPDLKKGSTDMRKSIDGLAALVQQGFALDPFSPCLFVFCNKSRNKLKILQWDHNGFWLHYRLLEKGKFQWPSQTSQPIAISGRELHWLLDGLSIRQTQAHPTMTVDTVI